LPDTVRRRCRYRRDRVWVHCRDRTRRGRPPL